MAIKLAARKTVKWPVTINTPVDGGRTLPETFDVEIEVLKQSELTGLGEKDLLDRVIVGWPKGPKGEDGEPVPYSAEAKAELIDAPHARVGLYTAYTEIQTGRAAARKN